MTIIYMAEDLFKYKDIDKKWELVKDYYERVYHIVFKERPRDDIIFTLHQKMKRLNEEHMFHSTKLKT